MFETVVVFSLHLTNELTVPAFLQYNTFYRASGLKILLNHASFVILV